MDLVDNLKKREREIKRMKRQNSIRLFLSNKRAVFGLFLFLLFLLIAVFAPVFYHYDHSEYFLGPRVGAPAEGYAFGFDEMGRDVFGAVLYGTRASIAIGILVTLIIVIIGATVGMLSGYYGGIVDIILMRITEGFMLLPSLPLMLILAAILGGKFSNIIIILGITGWTSTARLVRSQTLTIKQRAYVERAKAIGASDLYIMFKHILPNIFTLIFSNMILLVQGAIITESTLAFLGIGDPSIPTWGQLLRSARMEGAISIGAWWLYIPAGTCLVLLGTSFVFMGYGFDEILNPKLRKR